MTSSFIGPLALAASVAIFAGGVRAADLIVPSAAYPNIQSAINAASDSDVVRVGPGLYNERLNLLGKRVSVIGAGQFVTIIDPQGGAGHLLACASGETTSTVVEGIGFRLSPTGAVYLHGSGLTLRRCRFQSNSGQRGAAVFADSGSSVVLDQCTCASNSAVELGGAVFLDRSSSLQVTNSWFQGNSAVEGGAIYASGNSSISVSGTEFRLNTAVVGAGALRVSSVSGSVANCRFIDNLAGLGPREPRGGSVWVQGSGPEFSSCQFEGCVCAADYWECCNANVARGGSVFVDAGATARFSACSWSRAWARSANAFGGNLSWGGGICGNDNSSIVLDGCSFSECRATSVNSGWGGFSRGGAIHVRASSPLIDRCEFRDCSTDGPYDDFGGALYCEHFSAPTVLGSTFLRCAARDGGAAFMVGRSSAVYGACEFRDCIGRGSGGVAYAGDSPALLFDCLFQGNTSRAGSVLRTTGSQFPTVASGYFCGNPGPIFDGPFVDGGGNEFPADCPSDCNGNGVNDAWDLAHGFADCDSNGAIDACDLVANPDRDCDGDGVLDSCAARDGSFQDCDRDGVSDACEADCDADSIPDSCAIAAGAVVDCNSNGVPDSCDLATLPDCDGNGVPDACDPDCDADGTPDACEQGASSVDCDQDGIPDSCEIAASVGLDLNKDGILDSCQPGMQFAGLEVEVRPILNRGKLAGLPAGAVCYRIYATVSDPSASVVGFYGNSTSPLVLSAAGGFWNHPAGADLASGLDCANAKQEPEAAFDSWLTIGLDCADGNAVQSVDIDFAAFNAGSGIVDANGVVFVLPGAAQSLAGPERRVLLAQLTVAGAATLGGSMNLVGRNSSGAEGAAGSWIAVDQPLPAPNMVDCDSNGVHDAFDLATGAASDCDGDAVPDACQSSGAGEDCNGNGSSDFCDISSGTSTDIDANGIPDECDCHADIDGNGRVDADDLVAVLVNWGGDSSSGADIDRDGQVDAGDLGLVLSAWGTCG